MDTDIDGLYCERCRRAFPASWTQCDICSALDGTDFASIDIATERTADMDFTIDLVKTVARCAAVAAELQEELRRTNAILEGIEL